MVLAAMDRKSHILSLLFNSKSVISTILRILWSCYCTCVRKHRCSLWNCQERDRHRKSWDGRPNEDLPCAYSDHHGRYPRHLRAHRCCTHGWKGQGLWSSCWLQTVLRWYLLRILFTRIWACDRCCRRSKRQGIRANWEVLCWHDSHYDLRWSYWPLWFDHCNHHAIFVR